MEFLFGKAARLKMQSILITLIREAMYDLKDLSPKTFVEQWEKDFLTKAKIQLGSRKRRFTLDDAMPVLSLTGSPLDKAMAMFKDFMDTNPLSRNDYYKYVNSYIKGKSLNLDYFRHDPAKLQEYYQKADQSKEYNPFDYSRYFTYVLFMTLKIEGVYIEEFDKLFNVKREKHREYNPLTSIPSVLRGEIPFKIKEYDIAQAYPSFLFDELDIDPFDVYEIIDKKKFNILINCHNGIPNASLKTIRKALYSVYREKTAAVMTDERFNNKGKMFEDLAAHEEKYINLFVEKNQLTHYVRLHDGIVTKEEIKCEHLDFGRVRFKEKHFGVENNPNAKKNFYKIRHGEVHTSPSEYKDFFEREKFIRVSEEGRDETIIVQNSNKILKPINHRTNILAYLKNHIIEYDPAAVENKIASEIELINKSLLLLDPQPLIYHKATADYSDFPFANGVARV